MKVRVESFGAWVRLDDATLVAIDRGAARRLRIDGGARWNEPSNAPTAPLEAHVAVTSRCPVACEGCYQDASPRGADVPRESLERTLDELAAAGVFTVAFGGGEPLARGDLASLAEAARARGLTPVFTTSGIGLDASTAHSLSGFAQVNVSHDGIGAGYRDVRGFDGALHAERAIALLHATGIPVGVNLVVTRANFERIEETARHVRSLGARELQLLRYKPAGRAASPDYLVRRLTPAQIDAMVPLLERLSREHADALSIRIDCAMTPYLVGHVRDARALARWGVFGCEAGRHLVAVSREGALAPCSFAEGAGKAHSDFDAAWTNDAALAAFRAFVAAPPEPCASCALRSVCRGGCKVVSAHLGAGMAPDPECPRVREARG